MEEGRRSLRTAIRTDRTRTAGGGAHASAPGGERLRRLREERGLTQSQLAGDRLSKAFISQLENGRSRASLETVGYLAERLGVSVVALMPDHAADQEIAYLFRAATVSIAGRRPDEAQEFLATLAPLLDDRRQLARARRLGAELLELRAEPDQALTEALAAHEQATAAGDPEEATRSCNLIVRLHFRAARFPAALLYNQRSIASAADSSVPAALRAMLLNNGGQIHFALGDSRQALRHFREAAMAAEDAEDLGQLGAAALGAGEAARRLGDMVTAVAQAERAQVVFERLEIRRLEARVQLNLADAFLDLDDLALAVQHAQRAWDTSRLVKDATTEALAVGRLAHIAAVEGRHEDAMRLAPEAVEAARRAGDSSFLALAHASLGEARALAGDAAGSDREFEEALTVLDRPGTSPEMSPTMARREVLLRHGRVLRVRGDLTAALDCVERAAHLMG